MQNLAGQTFNYTFCNTSYEGEYRYAWDEDCVDCSGGLCGNNFAVNKGGVEPSIGNAMFYLGLLAILILFLVGTIYIFFESENLLARVGMIGLGYLLLIAISFIGWNVASDFITSAPFLISMLRILFFVLIAGLFPLVIGGFAWYVLMLFKIKEIERLMTKGFSFEDAERRQGRKYK